MNILEKHGLTLDNQGMCEIHKILDYVCDNCKHRWGDDVGGQNIRITCKSCRFSDINSKNRFEKK